MIFIQQKPRLPEQMCRNTTSYLKMNPTPPDGVVILFKMLTYSIYAALFYRITPCHRA